MSCPTLSMTFSAACLRTRTYGWLLALVGTGLLAVTGHAQEDTVLVSFSVGARSATPICKTWSTSSSSSATRQMAIPRST